MRHSISTVCILTIIFCLGLPVMAEAASKLPAGFIAISESNMTWADAKNYCEQQGGKLPSINGLDPWNAGGPLRSRNNDTTQEAIPIDGFGANGAPWTGGLPARLQGATNLVYYWTGTTHHEGAANRSNAWAVVYPA